MKLEERRTVKREQLAELLRRLGAEVEMGIVTIAQNKIPLPQQAELELEYKEKHGRKKVEIEVEWSATENGGIGTVESTKGGIGIQPSGQQPRHKPRLPGHEPVPKVAVGSDVSILPQAVAGVKENPQEVISKQKIASVSEIPVGTSIDFYYRSAPAILIHLPNGEFRAYAKICTHKGERVEWRDGKLLCPKHNAAFDPASGAALRGPAREPLRKIELKIEGEEIFAF